MHTGSIMYLPKFMGFLVFFFINERLRGFAPIGIMELVYEGRKSYEFLKFSEYRLDLTRSSISIMSN
ncbi:MAG: hypothetical protein B6I30_10305 [Desulfobacteraceae bacterium 4572_187]|nr:MAG: hypothetical protein B6I30_10305 [Desulfobacteraceae bacterium 4572_187]